MSSLPRNWAFPQCPRSWGLMEAWRTEQSPRWPSLPWAPTLWTQGPEISCPSPEAPARSQATSPRSLCVWAPIGGWGGGQRTRVGAGAEGAGQVSRLSPSPFQVSQSSLTMLSSPSPSQQVQTPQSMPPPPQPSPQPGPPSSQPNSNVR